MMKKMNNQNNSHFRLLIIIVFFVFACLLALLVFSKIKTEPKFFGGLKTKIKLIPTPTIQIMGGAFTISAVGEEKKHPLTDYLILEVAVDSQNINVVGYDVVVKYNTDAFELIQAESFIADFQIYKIKSSDKLTVTGAKKLSAITTNIWSGEKIIKLTFKPKSAGKFKFSLLSQSGREKTQLVDSQSKIYYPKTGQVEVEIY